jgi:D-galactarolactone cycloisomerase
MKIRDVRVRFFGVDRESQVSFGLMKRRTFCLVEVEVEDGTVGYGESWVNFPSWCPSERKETILQGIRPLLIGRTVSNVLDTQAFLLQSLERIGLQWGAPGPIHQAISGIDLALWDLAGKAKGLPVYRMFGGSRTEIPVYASGLGPIVTEEDIERQQARGIHSYKLKIGFGREQDLKAVRNLRNRVGSNAEIMVDANQAWDVREAKYLIDAMKESFPAWVEEPIRSDDMDGMRELVAYSGIPIAAGENLYGKNAFAKWINCNALSIAQPDLTKVGGFSEAYAVAQLAHSFGIPYAPHFMGSIIGLVATCHLFSIVPGGLRVELDYSKYPLIEDVIQSPLTVRNGHIHLSEGPGWGIVFDEDVLRSYELSDI